MFIQDIFNLFYGLLDYSFYENKLQKKFTSFREFIQETFIEDLPYTRHSIICSRGKAYISSSEK